MSLAISKKGPTFDDDQSQEDTFRDEELSEKDSQDDEMTNESWISETSSNEDLEPTSNHPTSTQDRNASSNATSSQEYHATSTQDQDAEKGIDPHRDVKVDFDVEEEPDVEKDLGHGNGQGEEDEEEEEKGNELLCPPLEYEEERAMDFCVQQRVRRRRRRRCTNCDVAPIDIDALEKQILQQIEQNQRSPIEPM